MSDPDGLVPLSDVLEEVLSEIDEISDLHDEWERAGRPLPKLEDKEPRG